MSESPNLNNMKVEHLLVVSTKLENANVGGVSSTRGPGINYVCAECGALLYHSGNDGAYEDGAVSFPAKQPADVAGRLKQCSRCGHKLNSEPDSDSIRINMKPHKTLDSKSEVPMALNRLVSGGSERVDERRT